jgi:signal peptidase I
LSQKHPELKLLRVNSSASEPSLRPGRFFLASAFKKPKRFDLISYRAVMPNKGPTILTQRLCGLPGDVVEIRTGVLYVDGKEADSTLPLKNIWKMDVTESDAIEYNKAQAYTIPPYTDDIYISLEDNYVKSRKLKCERYVLPQGLRDEIIHLVYRHNWNRDQFGPVKVPPNKWFFLGDNRGQAIDSRYLGFADPKNFVGAVIWK